MGDILNHYLIIEASEEEHAKVAHAKATEIFSRQVADGVQRGVDVASVGEIKQLPINGFWTFVIYPSGSKIGWDAFKHEDDLRDAFVAWLREQKGEDYAGPLRSIRWAEVRLGGWAFGSGSIVTRSDSGDGRDAYHGEPGFG